MLTLTTELLDRYRVALVCPPTSAGLRLLGRAKSLGLATLALEVRGARSARESLAAWLSMWRTDVFHVHAGIAWEGHDGVRGARAAGVRIVVRTEHLPYLITDLAQREEYRTLIPSVDRFICVSEDIRRSFVRAGVPMRALRIVRNGIHPRLARRDRDGVRAGLGLRPDDRVVLTVGRLTEQKGHRHLVRAIPSIADLEPSVRFLWAGDGPLDGELHELVRRAGAEGHVRFLGPRDDVPDLLGAADAFVLPSLFEGLPLAVLEAMAAGLPVVATRAGGTAEVVADGITGHLVPPGDGAALAEAIAGVLRRPDRARTWACAGRSRFEREFHASRMARETSAIYQELLGTPRPDRAVVGAVG